MIFDRDHWQELYGALRSNKLRTGLTAFGVFWGVFMLMVMLGAGTGLHNGVDEGFSDVATNSFFVWTERTSKPYRGLPAGRNFELDNQDTLALAEQVGEARAICPRNQLGGYRGGNNVARNTKTGAFSIMGDYPEIRQIQSVLITHGRFLDAFDLAERRKVAVIGPRAAEVLFAPGEEMIGEQIRINGVYFKIIGVFRSRRSGEDAERDAQTIYIPFTTFQNAFNYGDRVGWFAITSRDGVPASAAEAHVLELLKRRHRVAPDDGRALGHYNVEREYRQIQGLFRGIRALIWIVGLGTLAAGVIGVSNIMLVIVRERTNEIGIRRAVGASPASIMAQVVVEAVLLTTAAGYVGLIAGMGLVDLIATSTGRAAEGPTMFRHPEVSLSSALVALAILIVSGTLAGIIPARRAVRVSPVEALRAEP